MKINKNILIVIITVLLVSGLGCAAGTFLLKANPGTPLLLESPLTEEPVALIPQNQKAKKNHIDMAGTATYCFTDSQRIDISRNFQKNQNGALVVRVKVTLSEKALASYVANGNYKFEYGFITGDEKSTVVKGNANEILNIGNAEEDGGIVDISLAFGKSVTNNINLPDGFFISSDLPCHILSAYIAPVVIGYDKTSEIPFYGFASNGGVLSCSVNGVDFTGASLVFPSENTKDAYMPEIVVKLSDKPEHISDLSSSVYVKISLNGEILNIKNTKAGNEVIIPAAAFNQPFNKLTVVENNVCVNSIMMRGFTNVHNCEISDQNKNEIFVPIRTDPGLILKWNVDNWRNVDYELFEWDRFPGIIYFDTRNYTVQDNFFRRLAFFAEKQGYKGRLLTNEELGTMHGFNALDYRPETLADFFNLATDEKFQLNQEEELLKIILLKNGLLLPDGNRVKPGQGGLVSISRESYDALRIQLLAHEAWHTLFFADEEFRNYVAAIYYTMDPQSLDFLIDYFRSQPSLGYDVNDDYLMKNEFMAYILQQPVSGCGQYFVNHAWWNSVMAFTPTLANYVINTKGKGFEDAAIALNDFVFDKYGLVAGNIALVQRP